MAESPVDKAIKRSAEENIPVPARNNIKPLTDNDSLYHELIVVLDEAGVLPRDWVKCNMFNYPNRPDILINFYVKDPTQDPLDLIDRFVILSYRVTDCGDRWSVEAT